MLVADQTRKPRCQMIASAVKQKDVQFHKDSANTLCSVQGCDPTQYHEIALTKICYPSLAAALQRCASQGRIC